MTELHNMSVPPRSVLTVRREELRAAAIVSRLAHRHRPGRVA